MGSVQTEDEMTQRRTWKPDEKLAVVLEVLKGQESVASLCHRHGVAGLQRLSIKLSFGLSFGNR